VTTYLLDTNVFAGLSQPKPVRAVERAFRTRASGDVVTASIVVQTSEMARLFAACSQGSFGDARP
jgi:predicted nucleic acid-binding protein